MKFAYLTLTEKYSDERYIWLFLNKGIDLTILDTRLIRDDNESKRYRIHRTKNDLNSVLISRIMDFLGQYGWEAYACHKDVEETEIKHFFKRETV